MKILSILIAVYACISSTYVYASANGKGVHKAPKTYIASVKRLKFINHELKELTEKHQLYKFHDPLELFDSILKVLPNKAETDIYQEMRGSINSISKDLSAIANRLDNSADDGDSESFKRNVNALNKIIKKLSVYSGLSNERKLSLGHNVPNTYKKSINRLKGVYSSLLDIASKGYLYKSHEEVKHIKSMSINIEKIFEENVIYSLKQRLVKNKETLLRFSDILHKASDEEDGDIAFSAFNKDIEKAIKSLMSLGSKLSSKSKNHHH